MNKEWMLFLVRN